MNVNGRAPEHDKERRVLTPPVAYDGDLLEVDDLYVRFHTPHGVVQAVSGVSLRLRVGEVLGIVGESGSGKTILTRRIMGLVRPSDTTEVSGKVRFQGVELTDLSNRELSKLWGKEMAMILQDPMTSLNPVKRIGVQITEHLRRHHGHSRDVARKHAVELLRSVGLAEPERRLRQYPHELSGGMRQRVTIAIAMACGPRLLFADEPTTALDVTVQAQILELLAEQQAKRQMAMILVTHDLGVVRGQADRIAVVYAGKVMETAPTDMLFGAPRMPYTEALMNAVPPVSGPNHVRLRAIPGRPPDLVSPPTGCRFAPRCPYAQEQCLVEEPPLRSVDGLGEHLFRCWLPVGSLEWQEAKDRNTRRGCTAAGIEVGEEEVAVV